jgi:hypothetical protein
MIAAAIRRGGRCCCYCSLGGEDGSGCDSGRRRSNLMASIGRHRCAARCHLNSLSQLLLHLRLLQLQLLLGMRQCVQRSPRGGGKGPHLRIQQQQAMDVGHRTNCAPLHARTSERRCDAAQVAH